VNLFSILCEFIFKPIDRLGNSFLSTSPSAPSSRARAETVVGALAKFKGIEATLGRPRKPRRIIQNVLSEFEVSRLIQAARNPREKAIISLLAYSGVRNSELRNIRRKDIDLGANHLKSSKSSAGRTKKRVLTEDT
jgi:integrase